MKKFKNGDRVVAVVEAPQGKTGLHVGYTGTVVNDEYEDWISVDWDENIDGHNCAGHARSGHGWNVEPGDIEIYSLDDESDSDIEVSLDDLFT